MVQVFVTDPSAARAHAIADELRTVFQDRLQGYREAVAAAARDDRRPVVHRPAGRQATTDRSVASGVLGAVVGFNLGLLGVTVVELRRRRQTGFRHIQM